jgi:hypothetical protein
MVGGNWGATDVEQALRMPCDELLPAATLRVHRAVSIDAPPATVFAWLCQLRLAPYSYDLLDNFGRTSPRRIVHGLDRLEVGQRFMTIFALASFARDDHVTLRAPGVAVTYSILSTELRATRLVVRVLFKPRGGRFGSRTVARLLAVGDAVMMRKQLLTLKELAERDAARPV